MQSPRVTGCGVWFLVLLGLGSVAETRELAIEAAIEGLIANTPSPYQYELEEMYGPRQYYPVWMSSSQLTEQGKTAGDVLRHADREGLNPEDYDWSELEWLRRTVQLFPEDQEVFRVNVLARYEVVLSKNVLKFLNHVSGGRVSPEQVNGKWHLKDERPPLTQMMSYAIENGIERSLNALAQGHEGYASLLKALKRYLQLQDRGGWPTIPDGPLLAKGTNSKRVKALRRRLSATGDLHDETPGSTFDQNVVAAVEKFQARHGLSVDGLVGPRTREALNVSVETRIQQLQLNMERHRWMPADLGSEYLLVNIPDFRLRAYQNHEPFLSIPIIMGKAMNQIPIFGDVLEYLVFNPYWDVPISIAKEEILPKFQADTTYLKKKNFEVVDMEGLAVDVELLTEENLDAGTIRIRQAPGPDNALGSVKFMFLNDHAIYLHDTPAGRLFEASERDFSHGCIRVSRPMDLAEFLLQGKWTKSDILEVLEEAKPQKIRLPSAIPVYIVYFSTWMAEDGTLQFREDLYGHDERLWAALQPVLSVRGDRQHHRQKTDL